MGRGNGAGRGQVSGFAPPASAVTAPTPVVERNLKSTAASCGLPALIPPRPARPALAPRLRHVGPSTVHAASGLTLVDAFCGAGGLSAGLVSAGFELLAAVDRDSDSCASLAAAHPHAEVICGDVARLRASRLRGRVHLLAGGPPCQPWSSGGLRRGGDDERDGWPAYLDLLDRLRPDAFLAENVPGMAASGNAMQLRSLCERMRELGYTVTPTLLDAADFGVPQRRRRLILLGARGQTVAAPVPTHGPGRSLPWRTAGEVLTAEPDGTPNQAVVTYARKPQVRASAYAGLLFNGGGRAIHPAVPAPTLLATMGGNRTPWLDTEAVVEPYHVHLRAGGAPRSGPVPGARRLTTVEAARVQTFPDGHSFAGTSSSQYRQIGNAVPPLLAEHLGQAVQTALLSRKAQVG